MEIKFTINNLILSELGPAQPQSVIISNLFLLVASAQKTFGQHSTKRSANEEEHGIHKKSEEALVLHVQPVEGGQADPAE